MNQTNNQINNIATSCYNPGGIQLKKGNSLMQPGPTASEFPENIFNTWLDFREAKGQTRAEIIREVNIACERKYDNNTFYKWKKQQLSVPDNVLKAFVLVELADTLEWFYKDKGFSTRGIDFKELAKAVSPPVKG